MVERLSLDAITAASLIFTTSLFGLLANLIALVCIYRLQSLHNSFGILCSSNCVASLAILSIFAIWVAPATLWQWDISTGRPGKFVGQTAYYFWYTVVFSTLCISINRFVAITFPLQYRHRRVFSKKNAYKWVAGIWLAAWIPDIPYFFDGCDLVYNPSTLGWEYKEGECGQMLSVYNDLVFYYSILGVVIFLDGLTLINIRRTKDVSDGCFVADEMEKKRRKVETNFFVQAFATDLVFVITQVISNLSWRLLDTSHTWVLYAATSLSWQLVHIGIPIVFLTFNREARLRIFACPRNAPDCRLWRSKNTGSNGNISQLSQPETFL